MFHNHKPTNPSNANIPNINYMFIFISKSIDISVMRKI